MRKYDFVVSKQNNVNTIRYDLGVADVYDDRAADKASQMANIVPFQYTDIDGKRSVSSYAHMDTTLEVMYKSTLSKKEVLCILSGLVGVFEIGPQGIPVSYIVREAEYIYVDRESLAVKCILVPIKQDVMPMAEIPAFFREVISNMRFSEADKDNYVAAMLTLINSDDFSVGKLREYVDAELEKMGLFVSKENGLMNMSDDKAPQNGQKDIKVNKLGVMNNMQMRQPMMGGQPMMGQPMMGQPQMAPQMGQPMMGQPQMGQPMMAPQAPKPAMAPTMGQPQMGQPMMTPPQAPQVPKPAMAPQMAPQMGQPPVPPQAPKPAMAPAMGQPQMGQPPVPPQMAPQVPKPAMAPAMGQPAMGQPPVPPQMAPQTPKPAMAPAATPAPTAPPVPPQAPQMPKPAMTPVAAPAPTAPPVPPQMAPQMPKPAMAPAATPAPTAPPVPPQAPQMPKPPAPSVMPAPVTPPPIVTSTTEPKPVEAPGVNKPNESKNDEQGTVLIQPEDNIKPSMLMGQNGLVGQLGTKPIPHIVRKKTGEIINITKSDFAIGKSKTKADYAIEDNSAISRVHCIIVQRDGVNYIMDNGSTNHTYVNGVELQPGKEVLLKNRTVIQMGDEEFTFLLRKGE